jgi:hypothetical protein
MGDGYWRPVRQPWSYHNEMHCGFTPPRLGSNNEPIGPGASVVADENPLRMVTGALVTYFSKLPFYVYHSDAGIRGYQNFFDYAVPANESFKQMRSYMPENLSNWTTWHSGRPDAPMVHDNIWPYGGRNGVVRLYSAARGNEVFGLAMGILNYTDVTARNSMQLDVIHPITGEIVQKVTVRAGERFRLQGLEAYVLKGVFF